MSYIEIPILDIKTWWSWKDYSKRYKFIFHKNFAIPILCWVKMDSQDKYKNCSQKLQLVSIRARWLTHFKYLFQNLKYYLLDGDWIVKRYLLEGDFLLFTRPLGKGDVPAKMLPYSYIFTIQTSIIFIPITIFKDICKMSLFEHP